MRSLIRFLGPFFPLAVGLVLVGCHRRETPAEAAIATQTLLLGNAAEPQDLDPSVISAWTDSNICYALYEGLTIIDEATTKPVPAEATSWDVSPDGLVYRFHLRSDGRWSNGDPVTADDFVYTFKRELSPNLAASYSYMLWYIKNAEAYNAGKITDFSQVGIKALDRLTLQVTLEKPTPYLPAVATHTTWLPVHQSAVEKWGKMDEKGTKWTRPGNLVGNGPFVLTEWEPNSRIVVVKNPKYWDAAHVRLNKIIFFPIEDTMSEELAFRAGQLQATYGLPVSKVPTYRKEHPEELQIEPDLASYYLFINCKRPPFDNPKLRRALSMSIDRVRISRDVLKGVRPPAYTYTPPDCAGYTARASVPDDFEGAKKLIAEAGYPGGKGLPSIEVETYQSDSSIRTLEVVQAEWRENLGVHITIAPLEQKTLFSNQQTGNYSIAFSSWIADYADPSTFLDTLHSGNGNNWAQYSSPEFDKLDEAAASDPDNDRRYEDFQKAEAIMLQDSPLIPMYYGQKPYLLRTFVRGWPINSKLGFHRFKNVWLEKADESTQSSDKKE